MAFWDSFSRMFQGNLGVLTLTTGLWSVASSLANPYFSLYVLALGGSYFDVGLTNALGNLLMIVPLVFAGALTDIIGRKKLVVYFGMGLALIYVVFSQAPSWEFLLLGEALNHLIQGFRAPAFASLVADSTRPHDRAFSIALWQRIPQAIRLASPLIGGFFIDHLGIIPAMRWYYALTFVACLVSHLLRQRYLKETFTTSRDDVLRELKSTLLALKTLPSHVSRQAIYLIGINALLHLASMTSSAYWVIYATGDVGGLTASEWGVVTLIHDLVLIVFSLVFASAADRYGKFRFVLASFVFTPITTALFPLSSNFTQVLLLRGLFSLFTSLRTAAFSALFIDYSPKAFRGRLNAFQRLASRPMVVSGNLLGGYLYQTVSKATPFYVNAGVMGLTGMIFYLVMRRSPQTTNESSSSTDH